MKIKLYTTHCPKCVILEKKLKSKNIQYEEITDVQEMMDMDIFSVPQMEVNGGKMLSFVEASRYINEVL